MTRARHNYINGEWVESETGETFEVRNPADTTDVIARCQLSGSGDARRAIEAAQSASAAWAATPAPERGRILRRTSELLADRKRELARMLTREEGKTLAESTPEVQRAIDIFAYYGEKARDIGGTKKAASSEETRLETRREPLGVAALITPWNYPIAIPAWKCAPALAAGNTIVLKPASQAPLVSSMLVECLSEAGLPPGVVNFVTGPGSEVGDPLVTDQAVDVVSFTGSSEVGNTVYQDATTHDKRAQCEMGGKNPTVVMPSASLEDAVGIVASGAFGVTGQACTACSRAIVHEDIYNEFVDRIVDHAESIAVGAGDSGADVGPQVSSAELQGTLEYIDIGFDEGATLETEGPELTEDEYESGYYVAPTVFTGDPEMRIAREEIFGPVLTVLSASDLDEAIAIANDVQYGLSASIVTQDLTEANRFVDEIDAGVVKVNEKTTGLELHVPFGGYKRSSTNTFREQGDAAIDFFTTTKTVYLNY